MRNFPCRVVGVVLSGFLLVGCLGVQRGATSNDSLMRELQLMDIQNSLHRIEADHRRAEYQAANERMYGDWSLENFTKFDPDP